MHGFRIRRPSASMSVAFVALIVALSGTAIALPGSNSVDSGDIRNGAVRSADIKNDTIQSADVKANAIDGRDVDETSLSKVPSAGTADRAGAASFAATANNAVRLAGEPASAYARAAQGAFTNATLLDPFENHADFAPASFMKDSLGFVHLRGHLLSCPAAQQTTAFVLPAGMRPATVLRTPLAISSGEGGSLTIFPNGEVDVFLSTGPHPCGFDGISFMAGQ